MPEAVTAARARIVEIAEQMAALREERRRLAKSVVVDALDQTEEIARRLAAMKLELHEIAESLPTLMGLAGEADLEEAEDEASQLRSAIECVIADSLDPAIENLGRATQSRRPGAET